MYGINITRRVFYIHPPSMENWRHGALMVEESDDSTPLYKYERNISETS